MPTPVKQTSVSDLVWSREPLSNEERDALAGLRYVEQEFPDISQIILNLPWVVDGLDGSTIRGLEGLEGLEWGLLSGLRVFSEENAPMLRRIVAMPWFMDGVTLRERSVPQYLRRLHRVDEGVAEFPWVADGIGRFERSILYWLQNNVETDEDIAYRTKLVLDLPWMADDLSDAEEQLVQEFARFTNSDRDVTDTILGSSLFDPFHGEVQMLQATAMRNISVLNRRGRAEEVFNRNWFKDGLTYEELALIAALPTKSGEVQVFEDLLEVGESAVHSKEISLPLHRQGKCVRGQPVPGRVPR